MDQPFLGKSAKMIIGSRNRFFLPPFFDRNQSEWKWTAYQKRGCDPLAKDVLCEVNNCMYWEQGNKCAADAIYVVSHKGKTASTSKETDCQTFEAEA